METIKKVIEIDVKSSKTSINSLKKEIKDLTKTLNDLEVGSEEYTRTLERLGKIQLQYNDINKSIRLQSQGVVKQMINMERVASGLAGGYGAITGAIALLGKNSEDVQKTMVKLQGTIALVQGLTAFRNLLGQLPLIKDWFVQIFDAINPLNQRLDQTAEKLNAIDLGKLSAPKDAGASTKVSGGGFGSPQFVQNVQASTAAVAAAAPVQEQLNNQVRTGLKLGEEMNKYIKESIDQFDDLVAKGMEPTEARVAALERTASKFGLTQEELLQKIAEGNTQLQKAKEAQKQLAAATEGTAKSTDLASKAVSGFGKVLKFAGWTALATVIATLVGKLIQYISTIKTAAAEQRQLNKELREGTAQIASKSLGVFKELQIAYEKVGDSAKEKQEFITKYNDKIKETGLRITTVKEAEDAFINNTSKYEEAILARAKVQASENQIIKIYEDYLVKRGELEEELAQLNDLSFFDKYIAGEENVINVVSTRVNKELTELSTKTDETVRKLFEGIADSQKKYGGYFTAETKSQVTSSTDIVKQELSELDKWLDSWLDESNGSEESKVNDKYDHLVALALKYNRDTTEIERARQQDLEKIRKEAIKKEEDERKAKYDKEWQDFTAQIQRIREANKNEPVEPDVSDYTTIDTSFLTKFLGLRGGVTYQTKSDLEQFKADYDAFWDNWYNRTIERLNLEESLIKKQLEQDNLTLEHRTELEQSLEEIDAQREQADIKRSKAKNKRNEEEKKNDQALYRYKLNLAANLAGSLASIAGEQTEVGRGFAVTEAIIQTYLAANEAYAALAGLGPAGPALGAAAAAAAIVAGIANVKEILSASESSASSISAGSTVSAPAALSQAPVNYSRNILGDKELEDLNQPVKCYVVESDITSTQTKVQVTENAATF